MTINIREIKEKKDIKKFILDPIVIYKNDPSFVPPILCESMNLFNPAKTPFFKKGKVHILLAEKNGKFAGRLTVHTNSAYDKKYGSGTGFFGFPEFIDDEEVSKTLFSEGEAILKKNYNIQKIIGPFNFDINNECGLLIEGFDSPPAVMMTHNPPYYSSHLEKLGYVKEKDLLAWKYKIADVPELAKAAADWQRQTPGLVIREADVNHLERDIKIVTDIYNDAWAENWGSLPIDEEESKIIARHLKPILRKELILIAEYKGEPVAVSFAAPNINEILHSMGKCNSIFDLVRFMWHVKFNPPKTARLFILGIKKAYRGRELKYLSVLLYVEMNERAKKIGIEGGELSWTLEDNFKINRGIELMGGKVYKKYRIYGKNL